MSSSAITLIANEATIGDLPTQCRFEKQAESFVPALYYSMKHCSPLDIVPQQVSTPNAVQFRNDIASDVPLRNEPIAIAAPEITPRLYNPYEGEPNALQIGETVEDFLRYLPPSTTDAANVGPWIWASNFSAPSRLLDGNPVTFMRLGEDLLKAHSTAVKIQELGMPRHTKAAIANAGKELRADTTKYLLQAARNCGMVVGKWMLFPRANEVDQVWEKVVRATVDGRLGISCKVATRESDDPGDVAFLARTRLICVYTYDFGDEEDVRRVLNGLAEMGLVPEKGGLWYKCGKYHATLCTL